MARSVTAGFWKSIAKFQIQTTKNFSTAALLHQKSILTTIDSKTGVAEVKMNKPPVNSLNTEFIKEINQTIKELENTKGCRGLILTSNAPNIFSAGLDILEMYQAKPERMTEFWSALQQMWIDLYGSKLPTIAAINGHAPAGGCLLAISCDYRVMSAGKYTIGLNETLLGIVAPTWFQQTLVNTVGQRTAEYSLGLGKLYTCEEALKIKLIDEVAASPEETIQKARDEISKWIKIPGVARQLTKKSLRKVFIDRLEKNREADIKQFVGLVSQESTQKNLGMYLESLKKKKVGSVNN